jgi:hypothetical protein
LIVQLSGSGLRTSNQSNRASPESVMRVGLSRVTDIVADLSHPFNPKSARARLKEISQCLFETKTWQLQRAMCIPKSLYSYRHEVLLLWFCDTISISNNTAPQIYKMLAIEKSC